MARHALLALALAAGVAGAAALPACTVGTTTTVQDSAATAESCVKGTDDVSFTFTVSSADAMDDVWALVWNVGQVAGFDTAPTLDTDGAATGPIAGKVDASTNGVFGYTFSSIPAGTHTIRVAESGGVESALIVLRHAPGSADDLVLEESGTAASFSVLLSNPSSTCSIHARFVHEVYQVQSVGVAVTGTPTLTPTLVGFTADSSATADGVTTFSNVHSGSQNAAILLGGLDITATYVDWTASPFLDGTVALSSVTEYPTLSTTEWTTTEAVTSTPQIYMVRPNSRWTNFSVISSVYVADGDKNDGMGTPNLQHVRLGFTGNNNNAMKGNTYSTASFGLSNNYLNPIYSTIGYSTAFKFLSPGEVNNPGVFFVMVVEGTPAGPNKARMNLKASVEELGGECPMGYSQCNTLEDEHPSSKKSTSANGEASRMRSCIVLPDASDMRKKTTKCIECTSDCDCAGGQYCHSNDNGICQKDNGEYYVCDSASYGQYGICVDKDPAEEILGAPCRTTIFDGSDPRKVDPTPALVAESVADALEAERSVSGGRYCGKALYYNNTPPVGVGPTLSQSSSVLSPANTVRKMLWQGVCVDHVCQECTSGATTCDSICIQGRWMTRVIVDFTSRTYDVNSLAGTMLAATLMIVVLQLCTCVRIMQAHRAANPKPEPVGNKIDA